MCKHGVKVGMAAVEQPRRNKRCIRTINGYDINGTNTAKSLIQKNFLAAMQRISSKNIL